MNKTIPFLGILLVLAVFTSSETLAANPALDITLSNTQLVLDQDETGTVIVTLDNTGDVDFTDISVTFDQLQFTDYAGNEILVEMTTLAGLLQGTNDTITISFTPDADQYLGDLEGTFEVVATDGIDSVTETFDINIETTSEFIKITLDDDELDDLQPGEEFNSDVEVDNRFSDDLKDVRVEIWIINIDDNDDLNDESSREDIDKSDDYKYKFTFDTPLNVDEDEFDVKIRVEGETDDGEDFEIFKVYENIVEVVKDENEEIQFDNLDMPSRTFTCGSVFSISIDAINTGEDDLDDMYLKLEIEGLDYSLRSDEFDLDSGDYDDREQDEDFLITLPNGLTETSYTLKILAYNEDNDVIGGEYITLQIDPCAISDSDDDTSDDDTEDGAADSDVDTEGTNTVYLPTGFASATLDKDTWSTIFWILGDILLVIIAIYFVVLIFRKRK
jgi:uncharacterized membrane protein